jgi:hypothetical protein
MKHVLPLTQLLPRRCQHCPCQPSLPPLLLPSRSRWLLLPPHLLL